MEHRPKERPDQGGDPIRLKHYSIRTEESYVSWMKSYIFFYNTRHPNDMASAAIEECAMHRI
jgi:Phage integrase, N-terminal SAM-like domain